MKFRHFGSPSLAVCVCYDVTLARERGGGNRKMLQLIAAGQRVIVDHTLL
jgi:hypothetical protein